jgi:(p)ppGpp synthase/HD superfamily hydrolase
MDTSNHAALAVRLTEAACFAAECHWRQRRKGEAQEPYVNHLAEVAFLLASAVGDSDPDLIVAGYLHDTIEDAGVTREYLALRFGENVASLVVEVTDDKALDKQARKQAQIENAPHKSVRAQWLKQADKISNLRSLRNSPPASWPHSRQLEYVLWAKQVLDGLPQPHPVLQSEFLGVFSDLMGRLSRQE